MGGMSACAPSTPPPPPSLFQRIGAAMVAVEADDGKQGITELVDHFVANVAMDSRINNYFHHTEIPHLKQNLVNQICQATGGPCVYSPPSMGEVHRGMRINNAAFHALVEDLLRALNTCRVPEPEQRG